MKYRITISRGMAGRVTPNDSIEDFESPRYGFYWWSWLPEFHSNDGKFNGNEVVDMDITWLCFWFGLIFWPTQAK